LLRRPKQSFSFATFFRAQLAGGGRRVHVEKLIEQGSVLYNRLTQVVDVRAVALGYCLCFSIIGHNVGMIHCNGGFLTLNIRHWISALSHDVARQMLGFADGPAGIFIEAAL
jgi:hypothetical protein